MTAAADTAEDLADVALRRGLRVGVAESLTSGMLASAVGAAPGASTWFAGGVVAYSVDVKQSVLGVTPGLDPCSSECAMQLAEGARRVLGADIAVSTTGVGGPEPQDGHPAGTVHIGYASPSGAGDILLHLDGPPEAVIGEATRHAVATLLDLARSQRPR